MLRNNRDKALLFRINLLCGMTYLLLGCSQSFTPAPQEPGTPSPSITSQPAEGNATQMTHPVEKYVSLSKKDLAERLQIDREKILLVKTAEMLWLNAALGCPRPGKVYPTGRVPGFQIWLEVEGTQYIYNTDFNDSVILCPELNPHIPNSDTGPTPGVPIR